MMVQAAAGRVFIGRSWEYTADQRGRVEIYLEPRDGWIGVYVGKDAVYVCPLPFVVIRISRGRRKLYGDHGDLGSWRP